MNKTLYKLLTEEFSVYRLLLEGCIHKETSNFLLVTTAFGEFFQVSGTLENIFQGISTWSESLFDKISFKSLILIYFYDANNLLKLPESHNESKYGT